MMSTLTYAVSGNVRRRGRGLATRRGVQYVHCVTHKCIMVKVGGNEIHTKYVKTRKCNENRGKFVKVGEKNNF